MNSWDLIAELSDCQMSENQRCLRTAFRTNRASGKLSILTIEPNIGRVAVEDPRLNALASIAGSQAIIPTQMEFVDIAGLVRGASKGEGLGNQFLSHIREVDAIMYVLRCFEDSDINPTSRAQLIRYANAEIIEMELILADLDSVEKRKDALTKKAKGGDKETLETLNVLNAVYPLLAAGKPARLFTPKDKDEARALKLLQLLTSKPAMYVLNVEEKSAKSGNALSQKAAQMAQEKSCAVCRDFKIEAEMAGLDAEDKTAFLADLGLEQTGLSAIVATGQSLLGLLTFFTVGPKRRAHGTCVNGATAPEAAGVIHTDFEKGFIRAETIAYNDYIACRR